MHQDFKTLKHLKEYSSLNKSSYRASLMNCPGLSHLHLEGWQFVPAPAYIMRKIQSLAEIKCNSRLWVQEVLRPACSGETAQSSLLRTAVGIESLQNSRSPDNQFYWTLFLFLDLEREEAENDWSSKKLVQWEVAYPYSILPIQNLSEISKVATPVL